MKTLDERNKGKRQKEEEFSSENLKDAGVVASEKEISFKTHEERRYPKKNKKREIKTFDETIEPNLIKLRKLHSRKGTLDYRHTYDFEQINGYYLETILCILLRERKFTREQISELFEITLHEATLMLKGKHKLTWSALFQDTVIDRLEKLGYTVAREV